MKSEEEAAAPWSQDWKLHEPGPQGFPSGLPAAAPGQNTSGSVAVPPPPPTYTHSGVWKVQLTKREGLEVQKVVYKFQRDLLRSVVVF